MEVKESFFGQVNKALVLCAHTDDELACAGTLIKLREMGVDVRYVALSRCEESVPAELPKDILETECRKCLDVLGIESRHVQIMGYSVRHFPERRQEILEMFYKLSRELKPDLVFVPTSFDQHQDHATVYEEGARAFKQTTILGYELPQNLTKFENEAFVTLSENQLARKIEGLLSYKSQGFRAHSNPDYIRSLAKVRGVQCGSSYAEAFEAIRFIIR